MARPRQISKIQSPPRVKGFMPLGHYTQEPERIVMLHLEEYEAIRLLDYEHLSQEEASGFMQVSRPTLTRIYERARFKIASALTEGRQVIIEGGTAIFEGRWFACLACRSKFNDPVGKGAECCPLCGSNQYERVKG